MYKTIIDDIKNSAESSSLPAYLDDLFQDDDKMHIWVKFLYYVTGIAVGRGYKDILLIDALDGLKTSIDKESYFILLKSLSMMMIKNHVLGNEDIYLQQPVKREHAPASLILLENAIIEQHSGKAEKEVDKLLNMADNSQNIMEKLIEIAARSMESFPVVNALFNAFHEVGEDKKTDMVKQLALYLCKQEIPETYDIDLPADFSELVFTIHPENLFTFIHLWMAVNNSDLRKVYIERVAAFSLRSITDSRIADNLNLNLNSLDISQLISNQLKYIFEDIDSRKDILIHLYVLTFLQRWVADSPSKNALLTHFIETVF